MMAKKGAAGFRLWFRKLSIRRFHNISIHRKRRPPHGMTTLSVSSSAAQDLHHGSDVAALTSPYHNLNSDSASPHHSPPPVMYTFSSSSPQYTFPPLIPSFSSQAASRLHSSPSTTPFSQTSPISTSSPARRSHARRRLSAKISQSTTEPDLNLATAVLLLSPMNPKAMDIPYPASGGSSPATLILQSPIVRISGAMTSPVKILSPPVSSTHTHTVLFKSPLHPFAHQILADSSKYEAKMNATRSSALDIVSDRNAEISLLTSRTPDASAQYACRKSQLAFAREATTSLKVSSGQHDNRALRRSISGSCIRQSPSIVDCGCRPNLSSSFRKTKKTLQSCGSCSSGSHAVTPVHDHRYKQVMQKLKGISMQADGSKTLASKTASDHCPDDTCINVFAEQGHNSHEALLQKALQQFRRRKKKLDSERNAPAPSTKTSNLQGLVHTSPLLDVQSHSAHVQSHSARHNNQIITFKDTNCDIPKTGVASAKAKSGCSPLKDAGLILTEAHTTLAWEREFSSFTSEDTFFSSFERSRPSLSSNSSNSECIDKLRLNHANPAFGPASIFANMAVDAPCKQIHGNGDPYCFDPANIKGNVGCQDAKAKQNDPLVEVSFHQVHVNEGKGRKTVNSAGQAITPRICKGAAVSESIKASMETKVGVKRGCIRPLVGIKEAASCEEGDTSCTPEQAACNHKRITDVSSFGSVGLQQKNSTSSAPECIFGSHADYYASARSRSTKNAKPARKKSSDVDVIQGAGGDTGSARIRRRAQLQAKWRLREERIHWQSLADDQASEDVDVAGASDGGKADQTPPRQSRMEVAAELKLDSASIAGAASVVGSSAQSIPALGNSESENAVEKEEKLISEHANAHTENNFVEDSGLMDSVAVVKASRDPLVDFRDSMVDMIIERQIYTAEELGELLRCFLSLNPREHHDTIVRAFMQVWAGMFQGS